MIMMIWCIKALKHVCLMRPISVKYIVHLLAIYRKYCKYGLYPVSASDNDQKSIYWHTYNTSSNTTYSQLEFNKYYPESQT
jgi:hypothetical protein